MLLFLGSSLPLFFLVGYAWPREAIPEPVLAAASIFPSEFAIDGLVRLNQMGADLHEVRRDWGALWGLTGVYFGLAVLSARARHEPSVGCPRPLDRAPRMASSVRRRLVVGGAIVAALGRWRDLSGTAPGPAGANSRGGARHRGAHRAGGGRPSCHHPRAQGRPRERRRGGRRALQAASSLQRSSKRARPTRGPWPIATTSTRACARRRSPSSRRK